MPRGMQTVGRAYYDNSFRSQKVPHRMQGWNYVVVEMFHDLCHENEVEHDMSKREVVHFHISDEVIDTEVERISKGLWHVLHEVHCGKMTMQRQLYAYHVQEHYQCPVRWADIQNPYNARRWGFSQSYGTEFLDSPGQNVEPFIELAMAVRFFVVLVDRVLSDKLLGLL